MGTTAMQHTLDTNTEQTLLGSCQEKGCEFALFSTMANVQQADAWRDIKRIGVPYRMANYGYYARCANGHKAFRLRPVQGTFSEVHKCDVRCLNAKGNECTCSCGGVNHGRGHAIAITSAVSEGIHLGEIGRHIRGTATVVGVRHNVGRYDNTLYVFLTDKGAEIKWFCPGHADPEYHQNQKVSFRAKVKRHEDNDYGKATVVTYLEEVA